MTNAFKTSLMHLKLGGRSVIFPLCIPGKRLFSATSSCDYSREQHHLPFESHVTSTAKLLSENILGGKTVKCTDLPAYFVWSHNMTILYGTQSTQYSKCVKHHISSNGPNEQVNANNMF